MKATNEENMLEDFDFMRFGRDIATKIYNNEIDNLIRGCYFIIYGAGGIIVLNWIYCILWK